MIFRQAIKSIASNVFTPFDIASLAARVTSTFHNIMAPEIAIVGGGPSGLALAGALERAGLDYIVYERSAKDTPPRGGCLDLHIGSGQDAMREAGCFGKFKKHGRLGDATVHRVWDNEGNVVFAWGEGRDAPEIDRFQLKQALLTTIPEDKILWRKHIKSSTRNEQGQIVLSFADGTTATGFKLVVGADGTWTKIRHLVCSTLLVLALKDTSI